jgi:radical SAM protein with 4Fe4S-binding SPASM domain
MQLSGFSRDSRLPCAIDKIVLNLCRRKLQVRDDAVIGLAKDIIAIPLNRGFVLCIKDLVLYTDTISQFHYLDGTHSLAELIAKPDMQSTLEQLLYYGLLSFDSNSGRLKEIKIDQKYVARYQNREFVTFSMVPLAVELNITNTCNFSCIHCSKDSKAARFPNELPIEEILSIIKECAKSGVPELRFMGGEPLAHPGFFKFIRCAKEHGIYQLRLSTNAWLIDSEKAKELSKCFDSIQISVHGASAAMHDYIVKKAGAWEQAKKATKLLKENGVKVNIGFTVMRENVGDVFKMPDIALEWGINSLGFLCLVPQGRGSQLNSWSKKEIFEMGDDIKRMSCKLGSCLNLDVAGFPPINPVKKDATVYGCEAGKTLMTIEPDGSIKSCGILAENFGTKTRKRTLLEIWHSPHFINMRRRQDCKDCSYTQICWGPCRFHESQMSFVKV